MKKNLPERSLIIKERLNYIIAEILAAAKNELAMVVLFGSYAKGTWVNDRYIEENILYSYESDLDLMIVTKKAKYAGYQKRTLQSKIEKKLIRKGLYYKPKVTLITETMRHLNEELEKSQYFFSDIIQEGVIIYDSGEFELAKPRKLDSKERQEIAKNYLDQWLPQGNGFLRNTSYAVQDSDFKLGIFLLHQATESFYSTILLVFTGYKPRSHDIEKLGSLAGNYSDELLKIFPRDTEKLDNCFILLQEAYIRARYDKNYKITEEQLLYLIERVKKLKIITEQICLTWIDKLDKEYHNDTEPMIL